ncbi:hypothetical protein PXK00_01650, partial [Phaeobacter sp. QD34_3]|nr:hypothetical protein [Phaeobacter sp. QD34_3]MDE4135435.1 hypothetical protein [Phaeobacter sp. QD34_24]
MPETRPDPSSKASAPASVKASAKARPEPNRRFLFLQGPHGPFFNGLGKMLRAAGCAVWRVGFNAGDSTFWRHRDSYIPYRGSPEERLCGNWLVLPSFPRVWVLERDLPIG